jgi:cytochrome c peroxidase
MNLRLVVALLLFGSALDGAASEDVLLRKAIKAFQIEPLQAVARPLGAKERLGQALFFDPFVSGPKSIACATCHVRSLGAGDGNRLAVGLGARGTGKERLAHTAALIVPRNVLPFFNRGSNSFRALFWDGRVQLGPKGEIETPLGNRMPTGFDNLLAAAAVFPLAEPDEMLGRSMKRARRETFHNELVGSDVDPDDMQHRSTSVFRNVIQRLLAPNSTKPDTVVLRFRDLFQSAYPDVRLTDFRIQHVGNALSSYIDVAFALQSAAWDKYVAGDTSAISQDQKRGAVVFFGKGRCAVCHNGVEFSDFRFHSLAIPQLNVGKHGRHIDYGRAAATSDGKDRFAFRTPPLRNAVDTGPWGHNGIFTTLSSVIEHHVNPVPVLHDAQLKYPEEASHAGRLLGFRSPILAEISPLSKNDVKLLIAFLEALTSPTIMSSAVAVPEDVPSGRREFIRH